MFYFWFLFHLLFCVEVVFSLISCCGEGCSGPPPSPCPRPNMQYRKGLLLRFNRLLYSVVHGRRRGVSPHLQPCPSLLPPPSCRGTPLRWPVGSHVAARRGDTSQSLFGLFMWGMIEALPTQDLREYVTAAREKLVSLSFFSLFFPSFSVPCSPDGSAL